METIRNKTIVKVLKWTLTCAFYAGIAVSLVVVGATFMTLDPKEGNELISAWPLTVNPISVGYTVSSVRQNLSALAITTHDATLHFASRDFTYFTLKLMGIAGTLGLWLVITYLLKRLFSSLTLSNLFTKENITRLRIVALLILAITPLKVLNGILWFFYIKSNVHVEGKTFTLFPNLFATTQLPDDVIWFNLNPDFQTLFTGLVMVVVVEVFRIGYAYKLDNESIL
jgi:hypothetical protein